MNQNICNTLSLYHPAVVESCDSNTSTAARAEASEPISKKPRLSTSDLFSFITDGQDVVAMSKYYTLYYFCYYEDITIMTSSIIWAKYPFLQLVGLFTPPFLIRP